ncbi:MAG: O-methyltransferase [Mycoplasma sp.]
MQKVLENKTILDIYNKSIADEVPIIRDKTVLLLLDIIKSKQIKNILEIGAAYGYSASIFALCGDCDVTTLEWGLNRFDVAKVMTSEINNLKLHNLDCFKYETNELFDMIFLDGPKSRQIELIDKFINNLKRNGTIVIDNIYLKKFLEIEKPSNNQIKILNELAKLRKHILADERFNVTLYDMDDGVAVLELK